MVIRFVLNFIALLPFWVVPRDLVAVNLFISILLIVFGQIFLFYGYKFITAKSGSFVSSSRILFAILFGIIILSETITLRLVAGGILILVSLVRVSFFEKKKE
jgi:drug/metabolite transporter (DMT)-like permease